MQSTLDRLMYGTYVESTFDLRDVAAELRDMMEEDADEAPADRHGEHAERMEAAQEFLADAYGISVSEDEDTVDALDDVARNAPVVVVADQSRDWAENEWPSYYLTEGFTSEQHERIEPLLDFDKVTESMLDGHSRVTFGKVEVYALSY